MYLLLALVLGFSSLSIGSVFGDFGIILGGIVMALGFWIFSLLSQKKSVGKSLFNFYTDLKTSIKLIFVLFITLVVLGVLLLISFWFLKSIYSFYKNNIKPQSWTLIICKTKLDDAQCLDTGLTIPGYKNSKECLERGYELANKQGFECGKNCESSEVGQIQICESICNKHGCK